MLKCFAVVTGLVGFERKTYFSFYSCKHIQRTDIFCYSHEHCLYFKALQLFYCILSLDLGCQNLLSVPQQPVKPQPAASSLTQTAVPERKQLMGAPAVEWLAKPGKVATKSRYFYPPNFISHCSAFSTSNVGNKLNRSSELHTGLLPGHQTLKPAALLTVAGIYYETHWELTRRTLFVLHY